MSTKDDVFNYVMNSPEDTNPAVLRSLLNGIEEGGTEEPFYIHFWSDPDSGEEGMIETAQEILDAYNAKKTLLLNFDYQGTMGESGYVGIPLSCFNDRSSLDTEIHFYFSIIIDGRIDTFWLKVYTDLTGNLDAEMTHEMFYLT